MSKTLPFTITAYATVNAFKVVTVEAETGIEANGKVYDMLQDDTDLQDGWTAMSELSLTSHVDWDIDKAHDKVFARPTGLLDDATLDALMWMVRNEVEASYERVANGGMEPEDRLMEYQDVDRAIAFLAANGADPEKIAQMRAETVNDETRAEIEVDLRSKEDAARDDAERAMAKFDLSDETWDIMPEAARKALIDTLS